MPDPATETKVTETANTVTSTTDVKPGWKTSEAWFAVVAMVISAIYALGLVAPDGASPYAKALALIAAALVSMGYSVSRGKVKSGK